MEKLILVFLLLVVLDICLTEPAAWRRHDRKRERDNRRRQGFRPRRPSRDRDSDRSHRFPDRHHGFDQPHGGFGGSGRFHHAFHGSGGHKNWFKDLFEPKRFSFGFGPENDPWFNAEFNLGWNGETTEPWWTGPNVCFSRNEEKENDTAKIASHMFYHSQVCDGSDTAFKCTTAKKTPDGKMTVTDVYECCTGYTRQPGGYGCEVEVFLQDIPSLLETLELGELIKLLDSSGLSQGVFNQEGTNFTLFAPTNEALSKFVGVLSEVSPGVQLDGMNSVIMVSEQISDTVVDNTRAILLGHVAVDRFTSPQFSDNQMIQTASPFKTQIRINSYQSPVNLLTANCKPLTSVDNIATNGVIHVTDGVLKPISETLLDLVKKNPELSSLKTALGSSHLAASLREDGHYTLFAPTDAAFKKHQALLSKIMANQKCLDNVLKNHLLPNIICSAIVQGQTRTQNMLNKYTNLRRDHDDKLYAEDAQIVTSDVMATNGVLYIIDDVILPYEALGLLELIKKDLTGFTDLIEKAGLQKEFDNLENVTVFVPSNDAIQALSQEVLQSFENDSTELQRVLDYHVVLQTHSSSSRFYNNMELATKLGGAKLRVNEYSSFPFGNKWIQTVQCADINTASIKGCNGVVYVVDKVLLPPVGNVLDVLARDDRFSTLVKLVKSAGLGDILQQHGPYTIFAPTNKAFDDLGSDAVVELRDNPKQLKQILLNHVTKDVVCCHGLLRSNWFNTQKVRTLGDEVFKIGKGRRGTYIGDAYITQCDITATNGVVHVIDTVLMKKPVRDGFEWFWDFV